MNTNTADMPFVDVTKIPDYKRDKLAKATLDAVRRFLAQPGGREFLDAKKAELRAQGKLPPKPASEAEDGNKC